MRREKYLLTCLLLSSVVACASNNTSEPRPEPPAPTTKPMALFDMPGVASPMVLVYFEPVTGNNKTRLCPKGTAFQGKVNSSLGVVDVTLPTGVPVDASPETGTEASIIWMAVDMSGAPIQPDPNDPTHADEQFSFAVFFSPLKGDIMRSEYNDTVKRYYIGPKYLRKTGRLPDNVNYKYTVATTKPGGKLTAKCEPLDPIIRILR